MIEATKYRVALWGTGNVGRNALAGVMARPDLELVGVWVSSESKAGKDAGELAGLCVHTKVKATSNRDEILALKPDCIVHCAMADNRLVEAIEDLCMILSNCINVVSSGPVFLQFPYGVVDESMYQPIVEACNAGNSSLFVNGIDPGFANDLLPLVLSGICEEIEEVRCMEILNYATYNQGTVLMDIMGFGKPIGYVPMLLHPGVLTMAWGSVLHQLAKGLGIELDSIEESYERVVTDHEIRIDSGTIEAGTVAALRFELVGLAGNKRPIVLEHVTRLSDDIAPSWPQPVGKGCYRVVITGEPNYTCDLQLLGRDGDHNTAGLKATAMRLVNSVPSVIKSRSGLISALDLPLTPGVGLVTSSSKVST